MALPEEFSRRLPGSIEKYQFRPEELLYNVHTNVYGIKIPRVPEDLGSVRIVCRKRETCLCCKPEREVIAPLLNYSSHLTLSESSHAFSGSFPIKV